MGSLPVHDLRLLWGPLPHSVALVHPQLYITWWEMAGCID